MKIKLESDIKNRNDLKRILKNSEIGTVFNFDCKFSREYIKLNDKYFGWLNKGKLADDSLMTDRGRYSRFDMNEILDFYSYMKKSKEPIDVSYEKKYNEQEVKTMINNVMKSSGL